MSSPVELLGIAAGILTTAAFVPQVVKIWRTRSARDLSAIMFLSMSVGVALWLIYGLLLGLWPVILANGITLCLAVSILWMRLLFGARPPSGRPPRSSST